MSWNVPKRNIVNRRVVIKHSDLAQNRANVSVFNQLGGLVFIEGASSQARAFTQFIGRFTFYIYVVMHFLL